MRQDCGANTWNPSTARYCDTFPPLQQRAGGACGAAMRSRARRALTIDPLLMWSAQRRLRYLRGFGSDACAHGGCRRQRFRPAARAILRGALGLFGI